MSSFEQQTHVSANTTIDKVKHACNLVIDWTGVSEKEMQALAQRSIVIKWQNDNRIEGRVPETREQISAKDYALGVRRQKEKETPEQMLARLSPEERAALIAKFLNSQ